MGYTTIKIDDSTGEVLDIKEGAEDSESVDGRENSTYRQRKAYKMYKERKEQAECSKIIHNERNFIMLIFGENFGLAELKPQTVTRLIYLSTWLEYDSNYLKVGSNTMTKSKMQELLMLKPTMFKQFFNEVTESGYLIEDGDGYRLNENAFKKGKINLDGSLSDSRFVKVYIRYIRELYRATPQNKHVHLGYVFKMIPYINLEHNIVCHNPLEKNFKKVIPMTVGEFCEAIDYDVSNASRLLRSFEEITFNADGYQYHFCGYKWRYKKTDMKIFVNPLIFFAGNDYNKVEALQILFY
ncbi:MAG: hypothetical protein E7508_07030 [Ruminococcus sp.]|nr:hypothetical protein [Ruminococcus sp.]